MEKISSKYINKIKIAERYLSEEKAKEYPDQKKIDDYNRRIRSFNKSLLFDAGRTKDRSLKTVDDDLSTNEIPYGFLGSSITDNKNRDVY